MSGPVCDVCGGSDPPRTPYWRDNQNRTCDPCEARIQQHVEIALEARATPPSLDENHICAVTLSDGTMVQLQDAADLIEQHLRLTSKEERE